MADTQYLKAAVIGPEYGVVLQGRADDSHLAANAASADGQSHRAVFPAPDPGAHPVDGTTHHRLSVHGYQLITVLEPCFGSRTFRSGKTIKPAGALHDLHANTVESMLLGLFPLPVRFGRQIIAVGITLAHI